MRMRRGDLLWRGISTLRRLLLVIMGAIAFGALTTSAAERDGRWAILVAGISGEPDLQTEYLKQFKDLHSILTEQLQFSSDHIFVLFDDPAKDPGMIQLQSTRENLMKTCHSIAQRVDREDMVFVFLSGHGSYDGRTYKFNLVGPDPTAEELATMLFSIPAQHFVIINSTNCSGASTAAFSGKGRIVITATKTGNERNQTHFSGFFVEALKNNNADTDKNGRVSLLEAFNYASKKVEDYYSKEGSLQTEHPVLDDNGDGQAHPDPGPENGDGILASTTHLDLGPALFTRTPLTPEQRQLSLEAESLEKKIAALKYAKGEMPEAEYEKQLEELLLKLAQINAKLRKAPGP